MSLFLLDLQKAVPEYVLLDGLLEDDDSVIHVLVPLASVDVKSGKYEHAEVPFSLLLNRFLLLDQLLHLGLVRKSELVSVHYKHIEKVNQPHLSLEIVIMLCK